MGWFRRNEHDEEQLSAYLDGELDARQTENVARHLSTCEACSTLLDELRETRALLSAMPLQMPRRSFVLGAEYAQAPAKEVARPARRFNPALAPAIALSVFVALLFVDLGNFSSSSSDDSTAMLTAATSQEEGFDARSDPAAGGMAPEASSSLRSSADGATRDQSELEGAPANAGGTTEGAGAGQPSTEDPPSVMSAEALPTPGLSEIAITAAGEAAERPEGEPIAIEAPALDDGNGITTLRLLQVLAVIAFLASGFYVFVWPRVTRGGS